VVPSDFGIQLPKILLASVLAVETVAAFSLQLEDFYGCQNVLGIGPRGEHCCGLQLKPPPGGGVSAGVPLLFRCRSCEFPDARAEIVRRNYYKYEVRNQR
jgi:hypothetical protein